MCRVAFLALLVAAPRAFAEELPIVRGVEGQPLLAQAMRLEEALDFLGSGLEPADAARLEALGDRAPDETVVVEIQKILDPYCLAMVEINPEARVRVIRGPAQAELIEGGWRSFLVKVQNDADVNAELVVASPNAMPILHRSTNEHRARLENALSPGQVANRFLELAMYHSRPLQKNLSGLKLEYAVVQAYSREAGRREAKIGFHVGQGTQDIGFRNAVDILFDVVEAVDVTFEVTDEKGRPTMASFIITDGIQRLVEDAGADPLPADYRSRMSLMQPWDTDPAVDPTGTRIKRLVGIYPLPSRRVAMDATPDFFFHPQVYRYHGEVVKLPAGTYEVKIARGPEYLEQKTTITVPEGVAEHTVSFRLERWADLSTLGWHSADHHVHAAGCSHYESPQEGVLPEHMWRETLGEDLDIACVLTWGPCWYHQKDFFEGKVHPLSTAENLIRYDVEVSGFPSSHAGHLVLLRLTEDDYPGTRLIEEWPSWTLPILRWAKSQGGVVAYSHSGWGLEPSVSTLALPNYVVPKMDGIGANEYVVTVTHDAVDLYSAGDTPITWELNMWYHTLNAGFRTRISGETDYPCIFDTRLGMARSYAKLDGALEFDSYMDALKNGRSYVSDGKSHIIDFRVDERELGTAGSELRLTAPKTVRVTARVAAYLPERQDELGAFLAARPLDEPPYWDIERARVGTTRNVAVELVVNGEAVDSASIVADGRWTDVSFEHEVGDSSWLALRILASSHTNPVFVLVDGAPIRASVESAQWCRKSVDRCWDMKLPRIRVEEREAARIAYDHARQTYDTIIEESRSRRSR
jgi:hypothetical protein